MLLGRRRRRSIDRVIFLVMLLSSIKLVIRNIRGMWLMNILRVWRILRWIGSIRRIVLVVGRRIEVLSIWEIVGISWIFGHILLTVVM